MFSVIVPTFNSEKTIYQTVLAILSQSYVHFEVIVVDNNSSDNTRVIVESFLDSRVSFHLINNHGMPAVSRNHGVSLAKFDFVCFCDSDDIWDHNKLETCLDYINNGVDFIAHDLRLSGSFLKALIKNIFPRRQVKNFSEFVEFGNKIIQSSVVVRRKLLIEMGCYTTDSKFIAIEDAHLWAKLFRSGVELCYINKKLGTYRYSSLALSSSANQFRAHRSLRLEYFADYKPSWYIYNIANYLDRKKLYSRSAIYLRCVLFARKCPLELRLKSFLLLAKYALANFWKISKLKNIFVS
jgi:glycosyltransferase involved in cell wall biosynthesis